MQTHPDGSTNTFFSQTNKQNNQEIKAPLGRFSLQILGKNNEFLVNTQEDLPGLGARGQAVRRVPRLVEICVEFVSKYLWKSSKSKVFAKLF